MDQRDPVIKKWLAETANTVYKAYFIERLAHADPENVRELFNKMSEPDAIDWLKVWVDEDIQAWPDSEHPHHEFITYFRDEIDWDTLFLDLKIEHTTKRRRMTKLS